MSSPGCLYWQDPQSHQTSSSNMRRDPCLEARSPGSDVNRIISGRPLFPPPQNSVRPSGGLYSDSRCTLPFHLFKGLFPGPLLSVASFLTSPTIRHICVYLRQTCAVIPSPVLQGALCAPGGLLIILQDPKQMRYFGKLSWGPSGTHCPLHSQAGLLAHLPMCQHCLLLKAVCSSGKDIFHFSACLWPLPAVSLSSRRVRLAQLGSCLENVAETKPRAARQGLRPGTGRTLLGAKSCFPPRSGDHCPGGSCSTIMLWFFHQFYCFLPLHLGCRPKGKKLWSVWGPGGWNMRQRTRTVAFLSFSIVKLKKIERNSHTIAFTLSKCTIQSVFKSYSQSCMNITTDSRIFSSPQKKAISNHPSIMVLSL